jgi:hypothetical protein
MIIIPNAVVIRFLSTAFKNDLLIMLTIWLPNVEFSVK